jgi:hypothetical protein
MLRAKFYTWIHFALIAALLLPSFTSAQRSKTEAPVDLSILKKRDSLAAYMTPTQKLQLAQLETAIEEAESDLRTGQHLANTKPSSFDPDRNIQPIIQRGKALVLKAETEIKSYQIELVQLLKNVNVPTAGLQASEQLKLYKATVEATTWDAALEPYTTKVLEACWELGYETLFFDAVFIRDSQGLQRTGSEIRNQAYDTLVKVDGSRYSVKIPANFKLKPDSQGNHRHSFSFENANLFENDRKALLVLELIAPENSSTGLLSIRAVDLETQVIAAHELVKINDLTGILDQPSDGLQDLITQEVELRDPAQTIELLAGLGEAYSFQITDTSGVGEADTVLTHLLLNQSALRIVDSAFILNAYGDSLDAPEAWVGQANAQLTLEPNEAVGSYTIKAQADSSHRILELGTLLLNQNVEIEAATEAGAPE